MTKGWKIALAVVAVIALAAIGYVIGRGSGAGIEHSIQFSINVGVSGDFTLTIDPTEVSCTKGDVLTFNIAAVLTGGFDANIQLVVGGLPEGSYTLAGDILTPTALTTTLTVDTSFLQSNSSYSCSLNAHDI